MNPAGAERNTGEIALRLDEIAARCDMPDPGKLAGIIELGTKSLLSEPHKLRPKASSGNPGGLVKAGSKGYFVIVPDLHGRLNFFRSVLDWRGFSGRSVLNDLAEGYASVICVGDAFHSEIRGRERWQKAMKEWTAGYKKHKQIDLEMSENLGLLEMLAVVKTAFPESFHFLKGNHENIANELGSGNYPFRKFVNEGDMVKDWMEIFGGDELFSAVYRWEKALPLMAEGPDFLVTHAEPAVTVSPEEVINAYSNPELIAGLTWTGNGQAVPGSVAGTLQAFGKTSNRSRIFGGHRVVSGLYSERQDGRYIQINRPDIRVIAAFTDMELFSPERDIICLNEGFLQEKTDG